MVFFAVGFETTAPANATAVWVAEREDNENFSALVAHVLVPPAMEAILNSPNCRVNAFLAAGHVCTVMGYEEYFPLALRYKVPIVVTGFEPLDLLEGSIWLWPNWRVAVPQSRINTRVPSGAKATLRRVKKSLKYSK